METKRRKWPATSQEERPSKKPTLMNFWSLTFSLQICKGINICCLSHPPKSVVLIYADQIHSPRNSKSDSLEVRGRSEFNISGVKNQQQGLLPKRLQGFTRLPITLTYSDCSQVVLGTCLQQKHS